MTKDEAQHSRWTFYEAVNVMSLANHLQRSSMTTSFLVFSLLVEASFVGYLLFILLLI